MKRLYKLISMLTILIFLAGCDTEKQEDLTDILPEDLITMEILDNYMFRDDVQYVDLRNFDAKFQSGYIDTFELIPFFDYLDNRAFDRNDGYDFSPDQLLDSSLLEHLFVKDKAIFLYADGCIRSGYLKDALNHLGYERVYVIGGFFEYEGQYRILGSGNYSIGDTFYETYIDNSTGDTYYIYGTFDMGRKITSIRFDIVDNSGNTLRSEGYSDDVDYNSNLILLEEFIVSDTLTFNELYDSITNTANPLYSKIVGFEEEYFTEIANLIHGLYID